MCDFVYSEGFQYLKVSFALGTVAYQIQPLLGDQGFTCKC